MAFITGTTGNDFLEGTQDTDVIRGLDGDDSLRGLDNADDINGNVGNDLINGNQGNDTLHGGSGNDTVYGGQGNDIIWGDRGTDLLIGGFGNDLFVLDNRDTASSVLAEADCIADFSNGDPRSVPNTGFGRDLLGLTGGITFNDLDIFDGTGNLEGDVIIQDRVTGKYLGIIKDIDRSQFTGEDFTTSIIPNFPSPVPTSGGGTPGAIITPGVLAPSPSPIPTPTPTPDGGGGDGGGGGGSNSLPNPCIPTPAEIPTPVASPAIRNFTVSTTQELIAAVAAAVPGDSIFVAPGIYDGPVPLVINKPNLTFFTNNASISGVTGVRSAETVLRFGFDLNGLGGSADGTRILGFTFDDGVVGGGNFDQLGFSPIVISQPGVDTDNVVIQNNRFLNVENNAIFLNSAVGSSTDNVTITGNSIDGNSKASQSGIRIINASNVDIFNNDITDYERGITLDSITTSTDIKLNHITDASRYGIQVAGVMENLEINANQITNSDTDGTRGAIVFFQSYDDIGTNQVCGNTINGNGVNGVFIRPGADLSNTTIGSNNFQQVGAGATGIFNNSISPIVSPNNFFGLGVIQTGGLPTITTPVSLLPYAIAPSF